MIPTQDIPTRGRSPSRGNDSLDDDDWAAYSDNESVSSTSTAPYAFFSRQDRQDAAPFFRLKKGEQDKPVYESWKIYYFPERRENLEGFKVLGVKVQNYEEVPSNVELRRQPAVQSELAGVHLQAIEGFKAKHKRCWATRALRGRGKSYEQDLDERCQALPRAVKTTMTDLLFDRCKTTSTRYRTRTWTVVAMQEQLQDRFAQTNFTEVKRHKVRFWKNPKPEAHLLYTVVIRGAETKVASSEDGFNTFDESFNPWVHSDNAEIRRKLREERQRRDALRSKRRTLSPSFRTRSPSYRPRSPTFRARTRSLSPPSYRSSRDRYDSPPPSTRYSRDESPPPYRRCTRGESPSRSPSVRIRVVPRYSPSIDDAPFPPTPPESFTPPPGVSAYHRPGVTAPSFPAPYTSPFHPRPPFRPPYAFPRAVHPTIAPEVRRSPAPTPANCPTCRTTPRDPSCVHHPYNQPCCRPIASFAGSSYHPPCVTCSRRRQHQEAAMREQLSGFTAPFTMPPPPPPPPPPQAPQANWFFPPPPSSVWGSVGPMPPTPNPFSPLSTPPLTSAGGSSAGGRSPVLSRARTPVEEEDGEVDVEVQSEAGSSVRSGRDGAE